MSRSPFDGAQARSVGTADTATMTRTLLAAPLAVLLLAGSPLPAQPRDEVAPGDYRVVAGAVDRGTFTGWRLFHSSCHGCHGIDGVGSERAPNLVERIKQLTPRDFVAKVLTSFSAEPLYNGAHEGTVDATRIEETMRRQRSSAGLPMMPAWEGDSEVQPHVLDLFAYLSARAEGQLGPGRPRRLP
jgi:mono/diheme cytochrome c family protein